MALWSITEFNYPNFSTEKTQNTLNEKDVKQKSERFNFGDWLVEVRHGQSPKHLNFKDGRQYFHMFDQITLWIFPTISVGWIPPGHELCLLSFSC